MPAQIPHGRMSSNRSMVCSSRVQSLLSGLEVPLQAKCFSKGICQLRQKCAHVSNAPKCMSQSIKEPALHRSSAVACKDLSRAHVLEEVDGLL